MGQIAAGVSSLRVEQRPWPPPLVVPLLALFLTFPQLSALTSATDPLSRVGTIVTFAGTGEGGRAEFVELTSAVAVAYDAAMANLYFSDGISCVLRRVDANNRLHTVAGNGDASFDFLDDGLPGRRAKVYSSTGFSVHTGTAAGGQGGGVLGTHLYLVSSFQQRALYVSPDGVIHAIAGSGVQGWNGDGAALASTLSSPQDVTHDPVSGTVWIADTANHVIRSLSNGQLVTVVGAGNAAGWGALGGRGTDARLDNPFGVTFEPQHNVLYIADTANARVLRYSITTDIIRLVAGIALNVFNGDGMPATSAALGNPTKVAVVPFDGSLLIADYSHCRVRLVSNQSIISTFLGTGECASARGPNGLPPAQTSIGRPWGIAVDPSTPGTPKVYVADTDNNVVRRVVAGNTSTVLGNGRYALYTGDGDTALSSFWYYPSAMAIDIRARVLLVTDERICTVRRIDLATGIITGFAGHGSCSGNEGNGGLAVDAFVQATSVAICPSGRVILGDLNAARIRAVSPSGYINAFAGTGTVGVAVEGVQATLSPLNGPMDVECGVVPGEGEVVWIADSNNNRVRMVSANGTIQTVAGGGESSLDGTPGLSAVMRNPVALSYDGRTGDLYIYCVSSASLKKLTRGGLVYRVSGTGSVMFSGDGALAVQSSLTSIYGLHLDASSGNLYAMETGSSRARVILANGTLTTVAGGVGALPAPGLTPIPARQASLSFPVSNSFDPISGQLYIGDSGARRVEVVQLESQLLLGKPSSWPQTQASMWLPSFAAPCVWNWSVTTSTPEMQAAAGGYAWFMQRQMRDGSSVIRIPCPTVSLSTDMLQEAAPCVRTTIITCILPYPLIGSAWIIGFTVNNLTSHIPPEVLQTGGDIMPAVWPTVSHAVLTPNMSTAVSVNPVWGQVALHGSQLRPLPGRHEEAGVTYNGARCVDIGLSLVDGSSLTATCNVSGSSLFWHPPVVSLQLEDIELSVVVGPPLPPPRVSVNASELVWGAFIRLTAPFLGVASVQNITLGVSTIATSKLLCQSLSAIDADTVQCRVTMLHESWFSNPVSVFVWSSLSASPVVAETELPLTARRPVLSVTSAPMWLSRQGGDVLQLALPYAYNLNASSKDEFSSLTALHCGAWIGTVPCTSCTLLVASGASSTTMSVQCTTPRGDLPLLPITVQVQSLFNVTGAGMQAYLVSYTPPVAVASVPRALDMPDLRLVNDNGDDGSLRLNITLSFDTVSLAALEALTQLRVGGVPCQSTLTSAAITATSSTITCVAWDAVAQAQLFAANNVTQQARQPLFVSFGWANTTWDQSVGLLASLRPEAISVLPARVQPGATVFISGRNICPQVAIVDASGSDTGDTSSCALSVGNASGIPPVRVYIGPDQCSDLQISVGTGVDTVSCTTPPVDVETIGYPNLTVTVCRRSVCSSDAVVVRYPSGARVVSNGPLPTLFIPSDTSAPVPLSPHVQGRVISDGGVLVVAAPCTLSAVDHSSAITNSSGAAASGVSDAQGIISFRNVIVQLPFTVSRIVLSVTCTLPSGDQAFSLTWALNVSRISFAFHSPPVSHSVAQQPLPLWSVALLAPPASPDLNLLAAALVSNTSLQVQEIGTTAEAAAFSTATTTAIVCRASMVTNDDGNGAAGIAADSNVFVQDKTAAVAYTAIADSASGTATWLAQFRSLTILGNQTSRYPLQVSCYIGQYSIPPYRLHFNLALTGCEVGTAPNGVVCTRCPDGYFSNGGGDDACHLCPRVGVRCVGGLLSPLPGFYRPPEATTRLAADNSPVFNQDTELHECYTDKACTLNTTTLEYGCTGGYGGPLCSVCINYATVKYARTGTICGPCLDDSTNRFLVAAAILVLASGLVYWALRPPTGDRADSSIALRVLLSYLQTLGSIRTLRTQTLSSSLGWTSSTSSTPLAISPLQCTFEWSSDTQFLVLACMPALIAAFVVTVLLGKAAFYARSRDSTGNSGNSHGATASNSANDTQACTPIPLAKVRTHTSGIWNGASACRTSFSAALESISFWQRATAITVLAVAVTYMPIVTSAMRQLDCYEVAVAGVAYVRSDMSLRCEDPARESIRVFSRLVLVLLGGGFPLLTFILLARVNIPSLHEPAFKSAFGFLYVGYKVDPLLATRRTRRNGILLTRPASAPGVAGAGGSVNAGSSGGALPRLSQQLVRRVVSPSCAARFKDECETCTNTRTHLVWWESVVLLRKCAIALVSVFILDVKGHLVAMMLVLFVCVLLQQRYNPYANVLFNRLEWTALVTSCASAAICMLLVPDGATPVAAATLNAATWMLILINLPTIAVLACVWLYLRWHQSKATVKKVMGRAVSSPSFRRLVSIQKLPILVSPDAAASSQARVSPYNTPTGARASPTGTSTGVVNGADLSSTASMMEICATSGIVEAEYSFPQASMVSPHLSPAYRTARMHDEGMNASGQSGGNTAPDAARHVMVRNPLRGSFTAEWKPVPTRGKKPQT